MPRKTLILNGSPREGGNTAALIALLKGQLEGEVMEISAFRSGIAPCVDCRACWTTAKCAVRDGMQTIYDDDFDNVVIASPVYYGTLPGQMLSLMSRLQPWHAAKFFLNKPLELREKRAAVILTAGGKGNADMALHHVRALCRMLNATGFEEHWVCSPSTDTIPADQDEKAVADVLALAQWLNGENA